MQDNKLKIGIDLDGVCRDFETGFNQAFVKFFPKYKEAIRPAKEWDWFREYPWEEIYEELFPTKLVNPNVAYQYARHWMNNEAANEIFQHAPIYNNVVSALNALQQDGRAEIRIVTMQPFPLPQFYTMMWLVRHQIYLQHFTFTRSHEEKWDYVDVMLDDSDRVLKAKRQGQISVKLERPYNRNCPADFTAKSVEDFVDQIYPKIIKRHQDYPSAPPVRITREGKRGQ